MSFEQLHANPKSGIHTMYGASSVTNHFCSCTMKSPIKFFFFTTGTQEPASSVQMKITNIHKFNIDNESLSSIFNIQSPLDYHGIAILSSVSNGWLS
jgi:hypothetical protein